MGVIGPLTDTLIPANEHPIDGGAEHAMHQEDHLVRGLFLGQSMHAEEIFIRSL